MKTSLFAILAFAMLAFAPLVTAIAVPLGTVDECRQAIKDRTLTGGFNTQTGTAGVTNNAAKAFQVTLATYEMPDDDISHQTAVYDFVTTVAQPGVTTQLTVELPTCKYQYDLVCGEVLYSLADYPTIKYGDKKIKSGWIGTDNFCAPPHDVPEFGGVLAMGALGVLGAGLVVRKRY
jgi:hypothetical protein